MSTPSYDAFVSYPRADPARAVELIRALEGSGLRVAWDGTLRPGQIWPEVLERMVATSRWTLVCISPAAVRSNFVEAEMRRSDGKIIPVLLEKTALPLNWEAHIGRIQWSDLTGSRFSSDDPVFAQLCTAIAGHIPIEQATGPRTIEERARQLIEQAVPADLSLLIALAVLGGASKDDIGMLAADFEQHFRALVPAAPNSSPIALEAASTRLRRIGAEVFDRADTRFGVKVECARFVEPALGHSILALAWSDYAVLRAPILSWIGNWSADSPPWIRMRLALNLGILAQDERRFDPIWRMVLKPMLFDNARRRGRWAKERFEMADAALSIAALDPSRRSTVEAILDQMLAVQPPQGGIQIPAGQPATSQPEPRAAPPSGSAGVASAPTGSPASSPAAIPAAAPVMAATGSTSTGPISTAPSATTATGAAGDSAGAPEPADGADIGDDPAAGGSEHARAYLVARLALGFTGARYPDLAVTTMRRLADRGNYGSLARILGESFRDRMCDAKDTFDGSLWDPIEILRGLVRWTEDVPVHDRYVPLMIFVYGLSALPLASDRDDHLSLTSIMRSKRGVDAMRRGFARGLANPETRDDFEEQLRKWRDAQQESPVDPDPVMAVACMLFHAGPGDRDRNRVRFLFRHRYGEPAFVALAQQVPELSRRLDG